MMTRITDEMCIAADNHLGPDAVNKTRRILRAAGVEGVELHRYEIAQVIDARERARIALAGADRVLAFGPLPEHTCRVDADQLVLPLAPSSGARTDCPYGCRAGVPRVEV